MYRCRCKEVVLAILGRASTLAFRELAQLRAVALSRQKEVHAIFKPLSIQHIEGKTVIPMAC